VLSQIETVSAAIDSDSIQYQELLHDFDRKMLTSTYLIRGLLSIDLFEFIYWHKLLRDYLEELMQTIYDMSISYFQLNSTYSPI
jgi:hypothetical protein